MDAQTLAATLLALRILAVILLTAALVKQVQLIRTTTTEYPGVRWAVFAATAAILIGQVIPIVLDTVVAFGSSYQGRSAAPALLPASYALNNAIGSVIIGVLLAIQYYRPRRKR